MATEQLLGRDYAVVSEPQQFDDWFSVEAGYMRQYGAPASPTDALWGGVNAHHTERPWTMRAEADVGNPAPTHQNVSWIVLLVLVLALFGLDKFL